MRGGVGFHPIENHGSIAYFFLVKSQSLVISAQFDNSSEPTKYHTMKYNKLIIIAFPILLSVGCDKQKMAIEDRKEATKDAIDDRKDYVDASAKAAIKQTDINASIDKANIEANKASAQAQLDADKRKADAAAKAAKARVDAENK